MNLENNQKIIPSLAGVRACISNSERLLQDATKVTSPTSAALTELSLEEISKGWWLMIKLIFSPEKKETSTTKLIKNKSLDSIVKTSGITLKEESKAMKQHLSKLREMVDSTDSWKSLKDHDFKLKFMKELKLLIEYVIPNYVKALSPNEMKRIAKITVSKYETNNISQKQIKERSNKILEVIKGLDNTFFDSLDDIKNEGFYVEYNEGEFIRPSDRFSYTPNLQQFVSFMVISLKGISSYYGS